MADPLFDLDKAVIRHIGGADAYADEWLEVNQQAGTKVTNINDLQEIN